MKDPNEVAYLDRLQSAVDALTPLTDSEFQEWFQGALRGYGGGLVPYCKMDVSFASGVYSLYDGLKRQRKWNDIRTRIRVACANQIQVILEEGPGVFGRLHGGTFIDNLLIVAARIEAHEAFESLLSILEAETLKKIKEPRDQHCRGLSVLFGGVRLPKPSEQDKNRMLALARRDLNDEEYNHLACMYLLEIGHEEGFDNSHLLLEGWGASLSFKRSIETIGPLHFYSEMTRVKSQWTDEQQQRFDSIIEEVSEMAIRK